MTCGSPSAVSRRSTSIAAVGRSSSPIASIAGRKSAALTVVATSVSPPRIRSLRRASTPSTSPGVSSWVASNTATGYDISQGIPVKRKHFATVADAQSIITLDDGTVVAASASGDGIQIVSPADQTESN